MNILNAVEREAFDSPPVFNSFQRKQYFDFPSKLRRFAAGLRSPAYRVGFLFSAGYFKAVKRFFSPGAFHGIRPPNWWTKRGAILGVAQSPKIQCIKGDKRNGMSRLVPLLEFNQVDRSEAPVR